MQIHSGWEEELRRLGLHVKTLEAASSSYHQVLEENRQLYNQVQDLKGTTSFKKILQFSLLWNNE